MEIVRTEAEKGLIDLSTGTDFSGPEWLLDARREASTKFAALGLPNRRVEEWKYTDLKAALKETFQPAGEQSITTEQLNEALGEEFAGLAGDRIVIVNGRYSASLSATEFGDDVQVVSIVDAVNERPEWFAGFNGLRKSEADAVQALNLAMMQGGVAVNVKQGAKPTRPLHLIFVTSGSDPSLQTSRCYFNIGANAIVDLMECHVHHGSSAHQSNVYTELAIGDDAEINHVKFTQHGDDAVHLANVVGRLQARTNYHLFQMTVDGGLTRNQIEICFEGEAAHADISGTALLAGKSHADMTLVMDHVAEGCASRELFKTVLDDYSRAVFQGKVVVQPGAQKTDGEMMSKALLLSENTEFDSKPELEIYADDVLCGHGATTGQIDDDLMFYLLARGVPAPDARGLLIQAFVGEALELVKNESIRRILVGKAFERHKVRGALDFA